jgi:hypothetical protein
MGLKVKKPLPAALVETAAADDTDDRPFALLAGSSSDPMLIDLAAVEETTADGDPVSR